MSTTVDDLKTMFAERKNVDVTDVPNESFIRFSDALDSFLRKELINTDPQQFISTSTISVVANTASYALPATFGNINTEDTGLFEVTADGVDTDRQLVITGFGSSRRGFYIDDSNIVPTPIPKAVETLKLKFIPAYINISTLTGATGTFTTPDEYRDVIFEFTEQYYQEWDEAADKEINAQNRLGRAIRQMLNNFRRISYVSKVHTSLNTY